MRMASDGLMRYAKAILASLAALYLRYLLVPLLGEANPYHTVWLAVVFSAWYSGLGPSIASTLISTLGVWYWFLPPAHSFAFKDRTQFFGMLGFLCFSACIIALGESNRRASASRFRLAAIVDSSEDAILSKNLDGIIISWNRGAQRLFGWSAEEVIGRPVTIIVPTELQDEEDRMLHRLKEGAYIVGLETVRVTKTGQRLDVSLTLAPVEDSTRRVVGVSTVGRDITERKQTEAKLRSAHDNLEQRVLERTTELQRKNDELVKQQGIVRDLSARLLQMQDEERRRLARELHDSVGQLLAAISMNISRVLEEKEKLSEAVRASVEENLNLLQQVSKEIRTMSHLLHPPLLDEAGLESAIRWYIDGFAERSKIHVDLDMPPNFDRLSTDQEIALFRVVQECLTNIHRHSESATAAIRITREDGKVHLEVKDEGKGIPQDQQVVLNSYGAMGVGFRGMRERLRQLGGTLNVNSSQEGTIVSATLPLERAKRTFSDA
jgi:PAS domain S-box-containing protein